MIASIDMLLSQWGRWAIRSETRSVGFPSQSPMFAERIGGDCYGSHAPVGVGMSGGGDMQACDRAVRTLPIGLRIVVVEHYQRQRSVRGTAEACGFAPKAISQYLDRAHGLIAQRMCEERIGA